MERHAGAIVEKVIRSSGISIAELARRVRVDRRSLYNWFEQKDLKIDAIARIGYVLGYDFGAEFPELQSLQKIVDNNKSRDAITNDLSEDSEYWKSKYIALLENYNELLTKQEVFSEESAA
jgi:AcrR family transcriptional regulator